MECPENIMTIYASIIRILENYIANIGVSSCFMNKNHWERKVFLIIIVSVIVLSGILILKNCYGTKPEFISSWIKP